MVFAILAAVGVVTAFASGASAQTQAPKFLSNAQSKRLAQDIRPAITRMAGDERTVGAEILESVIATSASYREGKTLLLYSPIHAVVIVMYPDPTKKLFVYAFGFEELADILGQSLGPSDNYLILRYRRVPALIADLRRRLREDSNFIVTGVHAYAQKPRKIRENQVGLFTPILRQVDPSNLECIKTLDKAALIANIRNGLQDKSDESWFDHMTMGDVLTDQDGSKTMIFVNDLTRHLHLLVPVSQQGDKCIPGAPFTSFIQ